MKSGLIKILFCGFLFLSPPILAGENDMIAKGEFEIQMTPMSDDIDAGRMTFDKSFTGDMVGTSKGQMLSHRTAVAGSAGYVVIEHIDAILDGKTGGFTLQHSGKMAGGEQSASITVIPDSGNGDLVGLSGSMEILIKDGQHYYEFTYSYTE